MSNSKRATLPPGEQRAFVERILARISAREAAKLCGLSERTIRDWRREALTMNYGAVLALCRKTRTQAPRKLEIKERYWYAKKGATLGWLAVKEKYGGVPADQEYRKQKWHEWWVREGKHKKGITTRKRIRRPGHSKELAEFVGIVLGDGGITERQVTITLHRYDDAEYSAFVVKLIKELFGVPVGIHHKKKAAADNFVVSRTELVDFCTEKLGLRKGNKVKQQVGVPEWIKKSKSYRIACARGLVDTDGSVFTHRYKVSGKQYSYIKLSFNNSSRPLTNFVFTVFQEIGLHPRYAKGRKEVRIDSAIDMQEYFRIVGSHNPKHLRRYGK